MSDSDDRDGVTDAPPASGADGSAFAPGGVDDLVSPSDGDDTFGGSVAEGDGDLFANAFTDEIQNVTASDWDVDADALWGGVASDPYGLGTAPGPTLDFPV